MAAGTAPNISQFWSVLGSESRWCLLHAFNATDSSKTDGVVVSNSPNNYSSPLGQNVFNPPTVFSYSPADFGLRVTNLIGPELGILDTSTSYARTNFMNTLFLTNTGVPGIPTGTNRPIGTKKIGRAHV